MTRRPFAARPLPAAPPSAHVCKPPWAAESLLRSGERSSVHLTCSVCLRGTTWISNHLGKVVALPARGET